MAKEWKAEPKGGASAALKKKYERLLLAFERQLAEGAPQRPLANPQAAKAAQKQVISLPYAHLGSPLPSMPGPRGRRPGLHSAARQGMEEACKGPPTRNFP